MNRILLLSIGFILVVGCSNRPRESAQEVYDKFDGIYVFERDSKGDRLIEILKSSDDLSLPLGDYAVLIQTKFSEVGQITLVLVGPEQESGLVPLRNGYYETEITDENRRVRGNATLRALREISQKQSNQPVETTAAPLPFSSFATSVYSPLNYVLAHPRLT